MDTTLLLDHQMVFYHLCKGMEMEKDSTPDEDRVLLHYLKAYKISKRKLSKPIHCEVLKCIIPLLVTKSKRYELAVHYLEEYENNSYDDYERLQSAYFNIIFGFTEKVVVESNNKTFRSPIMVVSELEWQQLIQQSDRKGYTNLVIDFLAARGIHAELFLKDYKKSEVSYLEALKRIPDLPKHRQGRMLFKILPNYGEALEKDQKIEKSIQLLKRALNDESLLKRKGDLYKLQLHLGKAYAAMGESDSAYHYTSIGQKNNEEWLNNEYDRKVFQIQEKFDNDNLENRNKRNRFLLWIFGISTITALFLVVLIGLLLRSRSKTHRLQIEQKDKQIQIKSLQSELDGEYKERKRIALELHDSVSSSLTSLSTHLKVMEINEGNGETPTFKKIKSILSFTNEQIRNLSHKLYHPALLKFGFSAAVKDICEQYSNQNIHIESFLSNVPMEIDCGMGAKVFQIIQELLKNVLVHSQATEAEVHLDFNSLNCTIMVTDNGVGFTSESIEQKKGLGLQALETRLHEVGGKLMISKRMPSGVSVKIVIPRELFLS